MKFSLDTEQYLKQLKAAQVWETEHNEMLEKHGWLYDPELQMWTNPEHPETVIMV